MEVFFQLFWLLLIVGSLTPYLQQRMTAYARQRLMTELGRQRSSRVIALIHRQESISLLGIPVGRYIDIDDSEQVLRAIRSTPTEEPIDLILHTPGGLALAAQQIAQALVNRQGKVTVFVPHYAMSGGTLIALAASQIVMDPNAVLGPVDPVLMWGNKAVPAAAVLAVLEEKTHDEIEDETLMLADQARKALRQMRQRVHELLRKHFDEQRAGEIAELLSQGHWTHDYSIGASEVRDFGLSVSTDVPPLIYQIMALYPQPRSRRPAVQATEGSP